MKTATGIHITDQAMRLISLEHTGEDTSVRNLSEVGFEAAFCPESLIDAATHTDLLRPIEALLATDVVGPVSVCLPGGFFHLQKVPLEVASTEDRREQIIWEAEQVLIGDIEAYDIEFFPAGRTAFWTAIRKEIRERIVESFRTAGLEDLSLTVEPMALYHILCATQTSSAPRQAMIYWHPPWLAFAAIQHQSPNAAEITHICNEEDAPQQILINQHIRQRIHGDRHTDEHKHSFDAIHMCGTPDDMQTLIRPLAGLPVTEIPIFERLNTAPIASTQADHLAHPGMFAIAAGAALAQLNLAE